MVRNTAYIPEIVVRYIVEDWADDEDVDYDTYFDEFGQPNAALEDFQLAHSEMGMYDLEDGYAIHNIVVYVQSADKYYMGEYTELANDANEYDTRFREVFPMVEKTTVYK